MKWLKRNNAKKRIAPEPKFTDTELVFSDPAWNSGSVYESNPYGYGHIESLVRLALNYKGGILKIYPSPRQVPILFEIVDSPKQKEIV